MKVTEVRIELCRENVGNDHIRAFAVVTFDNRFVVHDLKVIYVPGRNVLRVFMPSRKLSDKCPRCSAKNHLRARYCNECGTRLADNRDAEMRVRGQKPHADVAHPIDSHTRAEIEAAVLDAYHKAGQNAT